MTPKNAQGRLGFLFLPETARERVGVFLVPVVILAATVLSGYFLYVRSEATMLQQMRGHLRVTAAMAALNVDAGSLGKVRGEKDMATREYSALLQRLQTIRDQDPLVLGAYVLRPGAKRGTFEYVVDANAGLKDAVSPAFPGQPYAGSGAVLTQALERAVTDDAVAGNRLSGYAPIRDAKGKAVALLVLEADAGAFRTLSRSALSPAVVLLFFLFGIMTAGYLLYLRNRHHVETLRRVDKERSGLLQLTFHQLGEPITIMQWSLETLSDNLTIEQLEKLVPEHITTMNEGLRRLNGIIDTLQFAEKIDLGAVTFSRQSVPLQPLLKEVAHKYETLLKASGQTLHVTGDEGVTMQTDPEYLKVVLSEVIGNAIAYSTKNCSVEVRVHPEHRTVHIDIQDHGCGIPAEDMPRLFEKYMRGRNAPLHKPDGNGLGLYICKGIVEGMGGTIAVDSVEDVGTKVSITLPLDA